MDTYKRGDKIHFNLAFYNSKKIEKEDTGEIVEGVVIIVDLQSKSYLVGVEGKMLPYYVGFDKVV